MTLTLVEKFDIDRLYTGQVNKGFKVQKIDGADGGWGVEKSIQLTWRI